MLQTVSLVMHTKSLIVIPLLLVRVELITRILFSYILIRTKLQVNH